MIRSSDRVKPSPWILTPEYTDHLEQCRHRGYQRGSPFFSSAQLSERSLPLARDAPRHFGHAIRDRRLFDVQLSCHARSTPRFQLPRTHFNLARPRFQLRWAHLNFPGSPDKSTRTRCNLKRTPLRLACPSFKLTWARVTLARRRDKSARTRCELTRRRGKLARPHC